MHHLPEVNRNCSCKTFWSTFVALLFERACCSDLNSVEFFFLLYCSRNKCKKKGKWSNYKMFNKVLIPFYNGDIPILHWNSGFCNQSQCHSVYTDEDCDNYLQGEKCSYSKCINTQGKTKTNRDRQGQKGTYRDKQKKAGTDRDKQGPKGAVLFVPALSLFVLALSLLAPACPCPVPGIY